MNNLDHVKVSDEQIFKSLELVADLIPVPFYWLNLNGTVKGCNSITAISLNMPLDQIINRTHYEFYPSDVAERLVANTQRVIEDGQALEFEETVLSASGVMKYFTTVRAPLRNMTGNIIGVVGASIDITAMKEAEQLRIENVAYKAKYDGEEQLKSFTERVLNLIREYQVNNLNERLGLAYSEKPEADCNVQLSKLERQVLYFLAMNKLPTEIAKILSTLENKHISPNLIQTVINTKLYHKFKVNQVSKLVDAANKLRLVPTWYDEI